MARLEAWEQQEGETAKAYEAFCAYRDMGPRRAVDEAYRETAEKRQKNGSEKAPRHWWEWAADNDWKRRAEAYDAHLELTARKGREEAHTAEIVAYRERCRKAAIQTGEMALAVLMKAGQRLKTLEPEQIEPHVLPAYLRAAASVMEASLNAEAEAVGVRRLETLLDNDRQSETG